MTERVDDSAGSTESVAHVALGAGAQLKRAREAAGIHVGALAVMLKVPVHRLEALESERWDLLRMRSLSGRWRVVSVACSRLTRLQCLRGCRIRPASL
jgi:hypothetical protein